MKDFLLVDFEFTTYTKPVGARADFSEIIEIGAVKLDWCGIKRGRQITEIL